MGCALEQRKASAQDQSDQELGEERLDEPRGAEHRWARIEELDQDDEGACAGVVLYVHHGLHPVFWGVLLLFIPFALAIWIGLRLLASGRLIGSKLGRRLARFRSIREMVTSLERVPREILRDPIAPALAAVLELTVLLLDALTLFAALRAIGHPVPFPRAPIRRPTLSRARRRARRSDGALARARST